MWRYPKEKLRGGWGLSDLDERTQAADQLGYRMELRHEEAGEELKGTF